VTVVLNGAMVILMVGYTFLFAGIQASSHGPWVITLRVYLNIKNTLLLFLLLYLLI
jgi:hypothetical protein